MPLPSLPPSWLTKLLFASSGYPLKYVSMGFPQGGTPVAGKSAGTSLRSKEVQKEWGGEEGKGEEERDS